MTVDVKQTLRGPLIPVITNLNQDLSIDHGAIRENVEFVIERGITTGSGILLAAAAGGDFPVLTIDERKSVAKTVIDAAAGRVPVLVGAQDTDLRCVIDLARYAETHGAFGVQVSAAYYYGSSAEDCFRLFQTTHEATSSIRLMIYNTPWEGYNMSLDDVARLAELPRCVCLKWSTSNGSAEYLRGVARFSDQLAVIDNQGLHVMNHLLGGTGYVTHLATVWPEHDLQVCQLMQQGDYPAAQQLLRQANWPWFDFRVKMAARTGAESPVIKTALELCGRPGGPSRGPHRALNDDERGELRQILTTMGAPVVA